jgi:protocatechuate 3,4-dioxygenase, beta subunit
MKQSLSRRTFLNRSLAFSAAGALGWPAQSLAKVCEATNNVGLGPYPPERLKLDENWDLTKVKGQTGTPNGEIIEVWGRTLDEKCRPVSGVYIRLHQADIHGKYDHSTDTNSNPLDPNFQYWGETFSDRHGFYRFRTILPGEYPGRAPHFHFLVRKPGYYDLAPQTFFRGHPRNESDGTFGFYVTQKQRSLFEIDYKKSLGDTGFRTGRFNMILKKV